ncbi:STAS domain-containing protein [Micromonospora sp. WMMD737]|uniref:STAS domain-containing protein n=1 Tax=Micromonospora sp. WMMD737 TaxID=3404113 RepID=UPI003B956D35
MAAATQPVASAGLRFVMRLSRGRAMVAKPLWHGDRSPGHEGKDAIVTGPLTPASYALPLVEVRLTQLDLACLPETGAVFDRLLALRPEQVVVDLAGCRYIDAAAIGLLLDVHRRLTSTNGVLVVRNPNHRIQRILHHTRLTQVLPIVGESPPATRDPAPENEPRTAAPALVALGRARVKHAGPARL